MAKGSNLKAGAPAKDMTASVQDYLAAVYDLAGSGKPVIGARLAKHMGISAPAVTEAIHRMARGGDVKIGRSKRLTLTPKGQQIAEVTARRHRLPARRLTDTLGPNWTDAHEQAHRRERRPVDRARPAGGREDLGVPALAGRMKIIFWLLVAVGCVYLFYSGGMTVWSYLEVKGVVEDVVAERAPKSERMYRATQVKE